MKKKVILVSLLLALCSVLAVSAASAAPADPIPNIGIQIGGTGGESGTSSLSIILLITVLSLAPAILVLMTSFTRIVVVLGFVRSSLGTQTMPPNQVLIGLALFLTLFVMSPTLSTVNEVALQPYIKGEITQSEALEKAAVPMKKFMYTHTRTKDLQLFMGYTKMEKPKSYQDIPLSVMVPAFAISELKTAFQMGFMIFIPFLIIDIVVSSVLMAMGMMMLPPSMISLPFKILLFVLVDGWYLVVKSLLASFNP
ncbi:flagellar type III secretion system pore protein FliP [Paenibacillus macerans]|uniref:Flagellar biosynthetic protein FliP n=1 Tax=Paenibacillus macerans TaxID=44252 RepID=A0A6N8F827_PAEMA|nr:flagellar type III secretion system pore protein FliP [Paenibacillus macerans]MEC0139465.1 flagellar type III secretion system pore protein FliP [Paenibacillus macerans]MED4958452.1 flagellar type III secretion system pore protein FliP [Paenibacillus macerans]MUG26512.1 flagellar type III secretion system pore protein FliP [Paenibacillus macerans]OMG49120.1 flagellar biosynthetic protein FliP [Paenibacillus macerans]UMV46411.1 flagellar type III secretion system pore protein FliP [Paenibaci